MKKYLILAVALFAMNSVSAQLFSTIASLIPLLKSTSSGMV